MSADLFPALAAELEGLGFRVERTQVGGHPALVARRAQFRWAWMATRLHTFVIAFQPPSGFTRDEAKDLSGAARQYAIEHKGGLPRGLQTGTATVALFLASGADPDAKQWFEQRPGLAYAALQLPMLADLDSGTVTHFGAASIWGALYRNYLRELTGELTALVARVTGRQ